MPKISARCLLAGLVCAAAVWPQLPVSAQAPAPPLTVFQTTLEEPGQRLGDLAGFPGETLR